MYNCASLMYFVNHVAIFLTIAAEIVRVCQGKSINVTNHGDHSKLGETMLNATVKIHVTSPLINVDGNTANKTGNAYSVDKPGGNASYPSPLSGPGKSEEDKYPLPILIASPAVAVGVVIFICVTYKLHSSQLDNDARILAMKNSESMCSTAPSCVPCRPPCRTKRPLLPPGRAYADDDRHGARRKSNPSLAASLPSLSNKRGSCWSALSADQEVLNNAPPRRHSTFVL